MSRAIKVDHCTDCPYARYEAIQWADNEVNIRCSHEEQESDNFLMIKINSAGINFNCPLPEFIEKEEEY